tara:strand:- start:1257 stop:2252 length:996 start_codon:yes stop_codon:yes gene_type:complete
MDTKKDSIAASNAWKDFRKEYMDRSGKTSVQRQEDGSYKKIEIPTSAEENEAEYNREKNEFYYDIKSGKMKLIPTDDGEKQDRSGIQNWQLAPSMKEDPKRGEAGFEQDPQEAYYENKSKKMTEDDKRLHAVSSITDKAIKEQDYPGQIGVDLGVVKKKSVLNMLGISESPLHIDDKRAKEISEMSINRSLAGKAASKKMRRTEVGRNLKQAGKVSVEGAQQGLAKGMQAMTEKAKPVNIPKPKPKKKGQSFEARSREHMRAPRKNTKMGISMKSPLEISGIKSPLNKISGPCKTAAKKKFKVWPSAYASGWGVRCTKAGGPSKFGGGKKK